jgi:outer membrane protein OmpA-like peptidoglycan-associated protein
MIRRLSVGLGLVYVLNGAALWANSFDLTLPAGAELSLQVADPMVSRLLPIGPFQDGAIAKKTVTAPIQAAAFRVAAGGDFSTLSLLEPLRAQIIQAGFGVIYDCEARICGGFDFRYEMDVLPEPEMHVDLGDYRYLLAEKGDDVISLMVSRSPSYGFVQVTRMGAWAKPAPKVTESSKSPIPAAIPASRIETALSGGAVAMMEGLVFASGQADLDDTQRAALQDLADWMAANPSQKVTITGHTDSSGQAAANMALSLARAETLRDILAAQYQIAADRISAIGAGDTQPLVDNATAAGRAQNRRVEVAVTP